MAEETIIERPEPALIKVPRFAEERFSLEVDYDADPRELARLGLFDDVNPEVFRFFDGLGQPLPHGRATIEMVLTNFRTDLKHQEVPMRIEELNRRSAHPIELLTFGVRHREEQRTKMILTLQRLLGVERCPGALCLWGTNRFRNIGIYWVADTVSRLSWFASVPK